MVFEVIPTPGLVRATDVRVALDGTAKSATAIDLLVLAADGGLPYIGPLEIVWVRGGYGRHLALRCPPCGQARKLLHADGRGGIACSPCSRIRTRRQRDRTRRAWRHLGERELDHLLRLLRPRSAPSARREERAVELVEELLAGDADRLGAVMDITNAALAVAASLQLRKESRR